ncbi:MAG TPA: hypothetical protein VEV16_13230 [Daejeonella sp.]|nr:hypothetical protein [Daejeonella sp.]
MNKLILVTSVLLAAVFGVAYFYFSNISAGSKNNDKALAHIPQDAALIFEFKNDKGFYEIFADYPIFDALVGSTRKTELTALKNVLLNNKLIQKIASDQNIFLSLHPSQSNEIDFLWLMASSKKITDEELESAISPDKNLSYNRLPLNETSILKLHISGLNRPFYLHNHQGIIAASFSKELLLQTLHKNLPKIQEGFIAEINAASMKNENSPANLFINFKSSVPFLQPFFKHKLNGIFSLLHNLEGFSTLNMNFKSDALMFNGITKTDTFKAAYLNLFLHQQPIKNTIKRLVPDNTSNFVSFGVSDYPRFHQDLKQWLAKRNELAKLNASMETMAKETGINPDRDIKKLWRNEFIIFQLSTQEKLGAIRLTNGTQLQFFLEPLSTEHSENIRHFEYPDLLYNYFGDPFRQFSKPYFTIIDNQLIVSNSPGTLQRFLQAYNQEKLLYKTPNYSTFEQLVADQSNVSFFIHLKNSGSNITTFLKPDYARPFKSEEYGLKDFYGISYQWSSSGTHFLSNFYAAYKLAPVSESDFTNTSPSSDSRLVQ